MLMNKNKIEAETCQAFEQRLIRRSQVVGH